MMYRPQTSQTSTGVSIGQPQDPSIPNPNAPPQPQAPQPVQPSLGNTLMNTGVDAAKSAATKAVTSQLPSILPGGAGLGGVAAGAYTGLQQFNGLKGVATGQGISTPERLALALPTFGLSMIPGIGTMFGHKNIRQQQADVTSNLLKKSDDPTYQNYVNGMRGQFAAPPPDPSHPFDGKYATWDEYKKGGLDPTNLTGVEGNISTFGPDWAGYSEPERVAITQALAQAGLYDSQHGGVVITDPTQALKIRDQVLANPDLIKAATDRLAQQQAPQGQGINPNALDAQMAGMAKSARDEQQKQMANATLMGMVQQAMTNSQNTGGNNFAQSFQPAINQLTKGQSNGQ